MLVYSKLATDGNHATDSQLDWAGLWLSHSLTFIKVNIEVFPCKPLQCSFSGMFTVVFLYFWPVNRYSSLKSLTDRSKVSSGIALCLVPSIFPSIYPLFSPRRWKASPQHDTAATMLHCGNGIFEVTESVGFVTQRISHDGQQFGGTNKYSYLHCGSVQLLQFYIWCLCCISD